MAGETTAGSRPDTCLPSTPAGPTGHRRLGLQLCRFGYPPVLGTSLPAHLSIGLSTQTRVEKLCETATAARPHSSLKKDEKAAFDLARLPAAHSSASGAYPRTRVPCRKP